MEDRRFFYVASFALLFLRPRWQPRLLRFGPVGQMALSVYIGQTAIGVLVFFGFGLGLLGHFGNSVTIPLGVAVFVLQVWASWAWLAHFRFARELPSGVICLFIAKCRLAE